MKTLPSILVLLAAGAAAACGASKPPQELVDARTAYQHAYNSQARQLSAAELHDARIALQRAEKAYKEDYGEDKVRTYAYVAKRRAQLSEIEAQTVELQARAQTTQSTRAQQAAKEQAETKEELEMTRAQLSERERELAAQHDAIEKLVRMGAAASVREEGRGTVLTLPGTLMFAPGKFELRPTARAHLNQIADAIKQFGDTQVLAEGHTDSTGSEETNQKLSEQRAESVRSYLTSRGVPANQISAQGAGEANPIADNKTADGRAENRRVELVFQRPPQGQEKTPAQPQMQQEQMQMQQPEPAPSPYEQ